MSRARPSLAAPFLRRVAFAPEGVDRESYPFTVPVFREGFELEFRTAVTFFVGENGSGKSTLMEAIANCCGFSSEGGGRDHQFQTREDAPELAGALTLSWRPKVTDGFFMRAESFFNFATHLEDVGSRMERYGGVSLHHQSHGESFLALFSNRFQRGIYILDEPEAALSPRRQLAFMKIIHDLHESGRAQFLIASHSPILLAYPNAVLLGLDTGRIEEVKYEDTDHFTLTKQFLQGPERFFKHLFADDDDSDDES